MFWDSGWACLRTAGSGSTSLPAPDLLVGNATRVLAIECKSGKGEYRYIDNNQVQELKIFAEKFGAEPWVGARFDGKGWFFIKAHELTSSGKNFVVSKKEAYEKGLRFEKLIVP